MRARRYRNIEWVAGLRHLLERAELYQTSQKLGGFFGARLKAFRDYVDFTHVRRVFDIGCGPGHIALHIPSNIEYVGFDTNRAYIAYANRQFGKRGRFVARTFDRFAGDEFGSPDLILMNGVLHHMDDETARGVVASAASVLPGHGVFFSLDGCFEPNQNPVSRFLLTHDRGEFVRSAVAYRDLVATAFPAPDVFVRDDLSWVPYTFAIVLARNRARP